MGRRTGGFNTGPTEFIPAEALGGDIDYERTGGCFVSTKKAILLALFAIISCVIVAVLMYFYAPNRSDLNSNNSTEDLEKLLNDSVKNVQLEDFRLPTNVFPIHYRLRIHPYLDEQGPNNFTFTGRVNIIFQTNKTQTNKIILNVKDLQILESDVKITMVKNNRLQSLSQVLESPKNEKKRSLNTTSDPAHQLNGSNVSNTPAKPVEAPVPSVQPISLAKAPQGLNDTNNRPNEESKNISKVALPPSNSTNIQNPTTNTTAESSKSSFITSGSTNSTSSIPNKNIHSSIPTDTNNASPTTNQSINSTFTVPNLNNSFSIPSNTNNSSFNTNQSTNSSSSIPKLNNSSSTTNQSINSSPTSPQSNNYSSIPTKSNNSFPSKIESSNSSSTSTKSSNSSSTTIESTNSSSTIPGSNNSSSTITKISEPEISQTTKELNVRIKAIKEDKIKSRYIIYLNTPMEPNVNYTLEIKFAGIISNNLDGLYKTYYQDANGLKRHYLTTHFQPIYARKVFPCFDEPLRKATFEISIARRTNMTALSNMPLKETEAMKELSGWVWDHFERSPPMPSYLVALTISDFASLNVTLTELGPVVKIWAPKHIIDTAQYAASVFPKVFSFYQNYFDIKYPIPKLDLIAVDDLPNEAMENWGIISFRKTALLLDHNADALETKFHIFETLAHELAHQWFGNLVTMKWWSELWLNEGFATYMTAAAQRSLEPAFEAVSPFPLSITQTVLLTDDLRSTHELNTDLVDPSQIGQIFDSIMYEKGASLLRMLNYSLTEPVFRQGIQNYLKTWSYKSTNKDDLWQALSFEIQEKHTWPTDFSIKSFSDSWTSQKGYPVIQISRNYDKGSAVISQRRFILGEDAGSLWYIPLNYITSEKVDDTKTLWLKQEKQIETEHLTETGNSSWILFNVEQTALCRVNYDPTNWNLLRKQLESDPQKISPVNRGQILGDAFELANAGYLNYETALELTNYLQKNESNHIPWVIVTNSIDKLHYILSFTKYNGAFQDYVNKLITHTFAKLGTSDKNDDLEATKRLRQVIISRACGYRYKPCVEWAKNEFVKWVNTTDPDVHNPIPYNFRRAILCTVISSGGTSEWEFLWKRTRFPHVSPANQRLYYLSLGCTRDPWLINSYLEKTLNGSIPFGLIGYVWRSISHPVGQITGYQFLREHWKRIFETYKNVHTVLEAVVEQFLSTLSTELELNDLSLFYKEHKADLASVSLKIINAVDNIKLRIQWIQTNLESVGNWLTQNNKK